jgi:undecaprenyl-diphosphatase
VCNRGVQSAIAHNVLGGLIYAVSLFVFWMEGAAQVEPKMRQRVLTILLATVVAIALATIAGHLITWPPPSRQPGLASLYANYIQDNPNTNCFPSLSTAVYSAVTAGIYSLSKHLGSMLWVGVVILVAVPRIYVGGHFPMDVLAGAVLGIIAYVGARKLFEKRYIARIDQFLCTRVWSRVLCEVIVFCWILQVALEFRDMVWVKNCIRYFIE